MVSFSGLGLSELYLNGRKVGDHVLSPAFAQYNQREFYVTYDVTEYLRRGANALGVMLGNGRFYADRSKVYSGTVNFGFPKLLLDLVYTIASQPSYPGWGYMIENGATTIWELWNGNTADPTMNSGNHVMLIGDYVVWLYEDLAGIQPDPEAPGFKHIIMRPTPVGDLTFVQATHESPYGLIASAWRRDGRKFDWRIEIPANTTATVYVPATNIMSVFEGRWHWPAVKSNGVNSFRFENGHAMLELGSGKYHFVSE